MKMKRYIGLILAVVMLLAAIPAAAYDPYIMAKGECGANGDNVTWTLSSDGTLTISGEGAMADRGYNYSWTDWIFNDYLSDIKSVVIESGVTTIGDSAFDEFDRIINLTIPSSVTTIGNRAFRNCVNLTSVDIPNGVITIEDRAFENCSSLESITISDSVKKIDEDAFLNTAYYNNEDNWENRVLYIGNHLIGMGSRTGSYIIRPGTLTIAGGACYKCDLKEIIIPDSVTNIGNLAFYGSKNLSNIVIPNSVTNIGQSAINNTAYYYDEENWEDNILYSGNHLMAAKALTGDYAIKPGTFTIAGSAFSSCPKLENVTIPDSVITIGEAAFEHCDNLTSVYIPDSVTVIENYLFFDCYRLKIVTIPDSVTTIGRSVFRGCSNLTDIYYGGSEDQWSKIPIGVYNDDLLRATIHFGIASTKIASLGATASDGVITVVLEAENIPETAAVFITACGKDGTPAKTNSAAPENGRVTTEFTDDAITKVKAFIWDAETLRPLCAAKEAEVVAQH